MKRPRKDGPNLWLLCLIAIANPCQGLRAQVSDHIPEIPAGVHFVASSAAGGFFWVRGECSAWRNLPVDGRAWFSSRAAALLAGYSPSGVPGCDAPPGWIPPNNLEATPSTQSRGFGRPAGSCTVERIVDGDTLDCDDGVRIRILLLDTPEMDQEPFGAMARESLTTLAPPGTVLEVELDVVATDRYGRRLAHLFTEEGISIGEEMVRKGMGLVSVFPPNVNYVERFRAAAENARSGDRGLWAFDGFVCPPSDHRAGKCDFSVATPLALHHPWKQ